MTAGLESRSSRACVQSQRPKPRLLRNYGFFTLDNGCGFTSGLLENCYGARCSAQNMFQANCFPMPLAISTSPSDQSIKLLSTVQAKAELYFSLVSVSVIRSLALTATS